VLSIVDMPKTEVHPRGEDCKDKDLEIFEEGVVWRIGKYKWYKDVQGREKQTACIVEYIMLYQGSIQRISGRPPVPYCTYERERDKSQLQDKQENKRQV
jgi:hypothetical protein